MMLGRYWNFGDLTQAYELGRCQWRRGSGGIGSAPPDLSYPFVAVTDDDGVRAVQALIARYPWGRFCIAQSGPFRRLAAGDWFVYDFDVLLLLAAVEAIGPREPWARDALPAGSKWTYTWHRPAVPDMPALDDSLFGGGGSDVDPVDGSEESFLRLDITVRTKQAAFLDELRGLCGRFGLRDSRYLVGARGRLLVLFSPGRQGLGLQPPTLLDLPSFTLAVRQALERHRATIGFGRVYDPATYPTGPAHPLG